MIIWTNLEIGVLLYLLPLKFGLVQWWFSLLFASSCAHHEWPVMDCIKFSVPLIGENGIMSIWLSSAQLRRSAVPIFERLLWACRDIRQ